MQLDQVLFIPLCGKCSQGFESLGKPTDPPHERSADLSGMNPEGIVGAPAGVWTTNTPIQLVSDVGAIAVLPNQNRPLQRVRVGGQQPLLGLRLLGAGLGHAPRARRPRGGAL